MRRILVPLLHELHEEVPIGACTEAVLSVFAANLTINVLLIHHGSKDITTWH